MPSDNNRHGRQQHWSRTSSMLVFMLVLLCVLSLSQLFFLIKPPQQLSIEEEESAGHRPPTKIIRQDAENNNNGNNNQVQGQDLLDTNTNKNGIDKDKTKVIVIGGEHYESNQENRNDDVNKDNDTESDADQAENQVVQKYHNVGSENNNNKRNNKDDKEKRYKFDEKENPYYKVIGNAKISQERESLSKRQQKTTEKIIRKHNNNPQKENDHDVVAGISCDKYGGPPNEIAMEMVYWEDIPSDANYVSPFRQDEEFNGEMPKKKYLTFEPDEGGWNNIRLAFETAVTMALAMGRTLVLPGEREKQKHQFSFYDFYPLSSIENEYKHTFDIMTLQEFLLQQAMTGQFKKERGNKTTTTTFPPHNQTKWDRILDQFDRNNHGRQRRTLYSWLSSVTTNVPWRYDKCIAAFPAKPGMEGVKQLQAIWKRSCCNKTSTRERLSSFRGHPTPVNATPEKRLEEIMAHRKQLCIYNHDYQQAKIIHLTGDSNKSPIRLLVHFYAFLFLENWKQDLWIKRFVRDHLRYVDKIQCAAARVVHALRQKAKKHNNKDGLFHSMHIRRGDFQKAFHKTQLDAIDIYKSTTRSLFVGNNTTLYIATDSQNKSYFDIFKKHYHVYFLHDFSHLIQDMDVDTYGMIDQLIASRGETFVGTYFSTFTGYINRLRGYHSQKEKLKGHEQGLIQSYFYYPSNKKRVYQNGYESVSGPFFEQEFPVAWRDLNRGINELHKS